MSTSHSPSHPLILPFNTPTSFSLSLFFYRTAESEKTKGGGVCLCVNERWAHPNNIIVKDKTCTPNLELVTVHIRPHFLPREFTNVIVTIVYIPPSANATEATETITSKVQEQDSRWPDAIKLIIGDFNHCTLDTQLPHYHQYVTYPTRNERTIDLAYSNVAEAYKCTPLPPLGDSDHNIISLMPKYRPILKTRKPISQQRRVLAPDSMERLQGCLECTDWSVFIDACDDFDELTDTINSYINFCEENVTIVKKITDFQMKNRGSLRNSENF